MMKFTPKLTTFLVAALITSGSLFAGKDRPNILMIAIDDLNNWIGPVGGLADTPNMDALASESVMFANAHCVTPACNPSRTALMTGQRPETTGQYQNAGNFRDKPGGATRQTLPQYLRTLGYKTAAAGKIFHKQRGTEEQPDPESDPVSWDEQKVGTVGTPGHSNFLGENDLALWHGGEIEGYLGKFGVWGDVDVPKEETGDWKTAEYCADYLAQDHDKPFILACGIFRPHAPLIVPQGYLEKYPLDKVMVPYVPEDDFDDIAPQNHANFSTPMVKLMQAKGEWQKAIQAYLASITFADDCVGHVLEALKSSKYADNTVVVFWSDHGWQLGHKDRWEKYSNWHQATNAPMMVKVPSVTDGRLSQASVSYLDIFPTLVELVGEKPMQHLEGNSFKKLLLDEEAVWPHAAVVTYPKGSHSIHYQHWNYIHYEDGSEELYDHRSDPNEFTNLIEDPKHRPLIERLKKWIPVTPGP
ncbi:MAG: sulfatase [Opitutales bacterium]|nr:sulfatase [Opitutales bacterium]